MAATKLGSVFVVLGVGRHRAWIGDGEVQGAIGAAVVGGETQHTVWVPLRTLSEKSLTNLSKSKRASVAG